MTLQGKNVLITGASRGLGKALALRLAALGARVVLAARERAPLDVVVEEIRAHGGTAFALSSDIADKQGTYRLAGQAAAMAGPIDVLINNASTLGPVPLREWLDTDCEDLQAVLETNLVGPFRLLKAVVGPMLLAGTGVVLNISSDAAVEAYPGWGAYSVSKAALDHLTRGLGVELAESGVKFLSLDPGEMNTRMHADAVPEADPGTLADPSAVAERISAILQEVERLPQGARLIVSQWEGGAR